eukprot:Phypoly_transcript_06718.p1 GENE.Phypoly_transcript_06718~~Phypoly_transcript_06718.p1  ORF type:complete len:223 (+),score=56.57 Phypoly_transcript_06718:844-1512(+)
MSHMYSPSVKELLASPNKSLTSDAIIKIIVIGPSGVGKSCLIYTFTEGQFLAQHDVTVGVEFAIKIVNIGGKKVKLQIWDTAGQESFRSVTSNYYRGSAGALLVYDVTKSDTFAYLDGWLKELRTHASPAIVVVGNKADLATQKPGERQVLTEEGQEFAAKHGLQFMEITAKNIKEVEQAFMTIAELAFNSLPAAQPSTPLASSAQDTPTPPQQTEQKKCCA